MGTVICESLTRWDLFGKEQSAGATGARPPPQHPQSHRPPPPYIRARAPTNINSWRPYSRWPERVRPLWTTLTLWKTPAADPGPDPCHMRVIVLTR